MKIVSCTYCGIVLDAEHIKIEHGESCLLVGVCPVCKKRFEIE